MGFKGESGDPELSFLTQPAHSHGEQMKARPRLVHSAHPVFYRKTSGLVGRFLLMFLQEVLSVVKNRAVLQHWEEQETFTSHLRSRCSDHLRVLCLDSHPTGSCQG